MSAKSLKFNERKSEMNTLVRENRSGAGNNERATEQFIAPAATVLENADGYTLEVEMPGVNKETLEMWIENNELTVSGRRSMPSVEGTLLHRELRPENFRRTFELDPSIDSAKISAKIEQGVVSLTLPKAEQVKPRKIAVA
jgi:HSP20 family protein